MAKNNTKAAESAAKLVKKKKPKPIPKNVQQTIPYLEAYDNGVMQVENGVFTKLFMFDDIPFKTQNEEKQEEIYDAYQKFLNTIQEKEDVYFCFVNRREETKDKLERISPILRGDRFDELRREEIEMLRGKMSNTRNNIITEKYLLIRVEADSVDKAMERLDSLSVDIDNSFKRITKRPLRALNLAERLELMYNIFNSGEKNYWFEHDEQGKTSMDFARMAKQGLTTKDIIAPMSLKFNSSNFEMGERYGQSMYLKNIANWMSTNYMSDLTDVNFECLITMSIKAIPQADAISLLKRQFLAITAEVQDKQKKALQAGYSPDFVPTDLKNAKLQIDALQEDMTNRDQRLFFSNIIITHFADDAAELRQQSKTIKNIGSKHMCSILPLSLQQERGFISSLPMGINAVMTDRLLTTESLGVFTPFNEISMFDKGGIYYGINSINKSMIVYNRRNGMNYNGLILGSPGSGKSFSAKEEIGFVALEQNTSIKDAAGGADILIVDPDGEYSEVSEAFGGSVIKIAPGNGVYINPMDLDVDQSADSEYNPIANKIDLITGMLETMIGHGATLNPIQKTMVIRCVTKLYQGYMEHLNNLPVEPDGKKPTIDRTQCPTLQNLMQELLNTDDPTGAAQSLALVMESYVSGSFDTFAHRTNVDVTNRIIVYDISGIGANLQELGLKVCLNDIWTRTVENRRHGRWTYAYIDEFHKLLASPGTASFVKDMWKRGRKFGMVPTGITQNVEDLLQAPEARAIINNSSFVRIMNQSTLDRDALAKIMNLSDTDLEFITNADPGNGLIITNKQTVPFKNEFPKDTKLYHIFSTNPNDKKVAK